MPVVFYSGKGIIPMLGELREIRWQGDSLDVVRGWSRAARQSAGEELFRLQLGNDPLHWRPMPSVGYGVREIRISAGNQYRVFYVTRRAENVYVLHAFEKQTRRTSKQDIEKAKRRLRAIQQQRCRRQTEHSNGACDKG